MTIGVVLPLPLLEWLDIKAKANGLTRSRMVATILLEQSGLDIELRHQGRCIESERKRATREITKATGQVPIGNPNLGW